MEYRNNLRISGFKSIIEIDESKFGKENIIEQDI